MRDGVSACSSPRSPPSLLANSLVHTNTRITTCGGGGNLIGNAGRADVIGTAAARIHVPRGARIHWLECALDGIEGGFTGTTRVFVALFHVRYADHSWVTPPARVASLEIQRTNDVGNNGRTFMDGVRIDHPRAAETDDGWFTLEVGFIQATVLGLRVSHRLRARRSVIDGEPRSRGRM